MKTRKRTSGRKKAAIEKAVHEWRSAATKWIRLMPPAGRAMDGSLYVSLPEPGSDAHFRAAGMVKYPNGGWGSSVDGPHGPAGSLSILCRRVAALAAPCGFRVGNLLRFEQILKRGVLPSIAHYQLTEDAEFEVMEMELALGLDPEQDLLSNWNQPLGAGPRAVLEVLVRAQSDLKTGRIVGLMPPALLARVRKKENKSRQVARWLDDLTGRSPALVKTSGRKGYYEATEKGKLWTGTGSKSGT